MTPSDASFVTLSVVWCVVPSVLYTVFLYVDLGIEHNQLVDRFCRRLKFMVNKFDSGSGSYSLPPPPAFLDIDKDGVIEPDTEEPQEVVDLDSVEVRGSPHHQPLAAASDVPTAACSLLVSLSASR